MTNFSCHIRIPSYTFAKNICTVMITRKIIMGTHASIPLRLKENQRAPVTSLRDRSNIPCEYREFVVKPWARWSHYRYRANGIISRDPWKCTGICPEYFERGTREELHYEQCWTRYNFAKSNFHSKSKEKKYILYSKSNKILFMLLFSLINFRSFFWSAIYIAILLKMSHNVYDTFKSRVFIHTHEHTKAIFI